MNNKLRRSALLVEAYVQGGEFDIDNYLTIVALEDGLTASLSTNAVEYCIDGDGNWTTLTAGATSPAINTGQTLSFRGNLTPTSIKGVGTFTISKSCELTGNCMSLLFGDNAKTNLSLDGKSYAFYKLFYNCSTIKNVSSNFLPATLLVSQCYNSMFLGCASLTTAPQLPATTLATNCYGWMFQGCSSLTAAPQLPATTLANFCYQSMFYGCSSLTTAPQLPARTLIIRCYQNMFYGCSSLTTAPQLPATSLESQCYDNMFYGCSSLTTAPQLPATTLATECYNYMFYGCSKLNYIKAMFTTIPSNSYTNYWVSGVASSGTFVKNKNATWDVTGTSGIPSGWTVQTA